MSSNPTAPTILRSEALQGDIMGFLSIVRLIKALRYSLEGLHSAFRGEAAFQLEVVVSAILIPVIFFLHVTIIERTLLILSLLLVLMVELINSAIEALADRISTELHPLSKKAKDIASAAVLLSLIIAVLIWGSILWPLIRP